MEPSEEALIRRLKEGDEAAWHQLFGCHYASLCLLAEQYVHDSFLAETIVGDVIFHLWEIRTQVSIDTNIRRYLVRSVHNRCLDYLKSERVRREVPMEPTSDFPMLDELLSDSLPLSQLLAKELERQIREAVDEMPEECGRVFSMSRFEGKSNAEIAAALGISVNTVKYHMKHALQLLRSEFGQYMGAALFTLMATH